MTSHDVVDRVRQMSGQRRVGHAGTLDPSATGVLVVCLGQATRVAEYLMASNKVYRAQIRLGVNTDTHDAEGEVTATAEVDVREEEIRKALTAFVGFIQQVPPMHSALKHEGTPLYKLARRGITIEQDPRSVVIHDIELLRWTPPLLTIRVTCSPGTYIRALARDLGQKLGCGAHLQSLTRLASGHFTLEEAVSLDALAEAFAQGSWQEQIHPMDEALLDFEPMVVDAQTEKRIRHGQQIQAPPRQRQGDKETRRQGELSQACTDTSTNTSTKLSTRLSTRLCRSMGGEDERELRRAYSSKGELIAILRHDPQTGHWQPKKVFKAGD